MKSSDGRKAAWKTFVDDLEGDTRLVKLDRDFLTAYKGNLDTGTLKKDDNLAISIVVKLFNKFTDHI